jgi:hypothetical protein
MFLLAFFASFFGPFIRVVVFFASGVIITLIAVGVIRYDQIVSEVATLNRHLISFEIFSILKKKYNFDFIGRR